MAARVNHYAEATPETSYNTDTSYADKVTLSFTPNANKSYLYIHAALLSGPSTGTNVLARLRQETSSTDLAEVVLRPKDATDYQAVYGMAKEDFGASPAQQTLKLQYATSSTVQAVKAKEARIAVLELGANDQYSESLAQATNGADTNYHATATLSWTAGSNEDYLIVATAEYAHTSTSQSTKIKLSDGTTAYGEGDRSPNLSSTNGGWMPWGTIVSKTLSAGQTWTIEFGRVAGSGTAAMRNARIVALRLSDFDAAQYSEARGRTTTTSAVEQDKATLTFTPQAVDHLILGCALVDNTSGTTNSVGVTLDEGGANVFSALYEHQATSHEAAFFGMYRKTLTDSSTTWKIQWNAEGSNSCGVQEAAVAVLQLDSVSADVTAGVGGLSATASAGSAATVEDIQIGAAGAEAAISAGSADASIGGAAAPTGLPAVASIGTAVVAHDGGSGPNGIQAAVQVGVATAASGAIADTAGVLLSGQIGSATVDTAPAVTVTGIEASGSLGAGLCSTSAVVNVGAPGTAGATGIIAVSFDDAIGVSGCLGDGQMGSILLRLDGIVSLFQAPLTTALGTILVGRSGWSPVESVPAAWQRPVENEESWAPASPADLDWSVPAAATDSWARLQKANGEWVQ